MPPRRHSADLRGRREDLSIRFRDMAAGLGIGLGRRLSMEDGTASGEDKTFYRRGSAASNAGPPKKGIIHENSLVVPKQHRAIGFVACNLIISPLGEVSLDGIPPDAGRYR
jgi:hypothetical protein